MLYAVVTGRRISVSLIVIRRGIPLGSESKELSSCQPMKITLTFRVCALEIDTEGFKFVCLLRFRIPTEVFKFRLEDLRILLALEHTLLPNRYFVDVSTPEIRAAGDELKLSKLTVYRYCILPLWRAAQGIALPQPDSQNTIKPSSAPS